MRRVLAALAALVIPALAAASEPGAKELLAKYDAIMGPESFKAVYRMVAHRDDDTQRAYRMTALKSGDDKFRITFSEPASARGQEILRQGDNSWLYMPNLKRSIRMANRDSFQGGDFNNADVLRANYTKDYDAKLLPDAHTEDAWALELDAKTKDAAYDRIRLWLRRSDGQPVKGEYYSSSGKLLRAAEFHDIKPFGEIQRPSRVVMKNMLATKRWSVLLIESMDTKVSPPASKFVLDDLGR